LVSLPVPVLLVLVLVRPVLLLVLLLASGPALTLVCLPVLVLGSWLAILLASLPVLVLVLVQVPIHPRGLVALQVRGRSQHSVLRRLEAC